MKNRKIFYLAIIICLSANLFNKRVNAQFQIDAKYRPRFEFRDGYRSLPAQGKKPSFSISQLSRLNFSYLTGNLKIKFSPQDTRVWGDEQLASSTGVYGDNASVDLHEGFAEIKVCPSSWISVGRQELVYDYERLLSKRNWNQNNLSYDAVVFKYMPTHWNIHLGSSWNALSPSTGHLYPTNRIKSLNFLWVNNTINKKCRVSFMHIASGVTKTDTTSTLFFRQTSGIYSNYDDGFLKCRGNLYYQYGKNSNGKNLSAYLADADFAYKLKNLYPGIGGSYLSGNKKLSGKDHLFDVLYGARHRYFGHMDYFRNIPSSTNQGGLIDIYAYINYALTKKINMKGIFHSFYLAQTNALTPNEKNLGVENELEIKYKFSSWGNIKAAYLYYLPTNPFKKIQDIQNDKFAQFCFLELTLTPALFNY